MRSIDILHGPIVVERAILEAVRSVDVFLFRWQRKRRAGAGVAHGDRFAARRWPGRRGGNRQRLVLDLEER